MSLGDFTLRLAVALVLGCLIGVERQWRQRMAGLRTNALVAIGAALFVLVAPLGDLRGMDPTRIAAQIVSGIGFLAGAVIFREGLSLRGLNTAATLWATAAVGTMAGMGHLVPSFIGACAVLGANVLLPPIVALINARSYEETELIAAYEIHVTCGKGDVQKARSQVLMLLHAASLALSSLADSRLKGTELVEVTARVTGGGKADRELENIVGALSSHPAVIGAGWRVLPLDAEEHRAAHGA